MTAAWTVFRAGVRRRWRAWVALALLIGLFGAVVTALAAGARRTDSAYPRLLTWSRAPDVMIYTADQASATLREYTAMPMTKASWMVVKTQVEPSPMEKAAPELNSNRKRNQSPMRKMGPSERRCSIHVFTA